MVYCTDLNCLLKGIDFSKYSMYGYILSDILIFIAGIKLFSRTKSTSTVLLVGGIGTSMLSDIFQHIAYDLYPTTLGDHFTSMVSYEFGFDGITLVMLTSMLGMVTAAIGLVTYVFSKNMPTQES